MAISFIAIFALFGMLAVLRLSVLKVYEDLIHIIIIFRI